jgi:hypothetical protein
MNLLIMRLLPSSVTASLLAPHMFLRFLFSKSPRSWLLLQMRDQISHLQKRGKFVVLHIIFLDSELED